MRYESNELFHYGIPKMHWGYRRFQNEDGSYTPAGRERYGISSDGNRKSSGNKDSKAPKRTVYTNPDGSKDMDRLHKDAKKDADEYAKAKAYYGEGAGLRRKKIKNEISEKMKDPDYKKEFEKNLKEQDMTQRQKEADRERRWNDTKDNVAKTARGVKNLILGVGSASIAALAIYNVAKYTGVDQKIASWGKSLLSKIGIGKNQNSNRLNIQYDRNGRPYFG